MLDELVQPGQWKQGPERNLGENDVADYLTKFVQSEIAKWAVPIKASGVSVD
jgi:hypothetical protein